MYQMRDRENHERMSVKPVAGSGGIREHFADRSRQSTDDLRVSFRGNECVIQRGVKLIPGHIYKFPGGSCRYRFKYEAISRRGYEFENMETGGSKIFIHKVTKVLIEADSSSSGWEPLYAPMEAHYAVPPWGSKAPVFRSSSSSGSDDFDELIEDDSVPFERVDNGDEPFIVSNESNYDLDEWNTKNPEARRVVSEVREFAGDPDGAPQGFQFGETEVRPVLDCFRDNPDTIVFDTRFGRAKVRRGRHDQPFISSNKSDYKNASIATCGDRYGTTYASILKVFYNPDNPEQDQEIARKLLTGDRSGMSQEQRRAAAMLHSIVGIAENYRVESSAHICRGVLRMIAEGRIGFGQFQEYFQISIRTEMGRKQDEKIRSGNLTPRTGALVPYLSPRPEFPSSGAGGPRMPVGAGSGVWETPRRRRTKEHRGD